MADSLQLLGLRTNPAPPLGLHLENKDNLLKLRVFYPKSTRKCETVDGTITLFHRVLFRKTKQALPPDYLGELFRRNRLPSSCAHCALSDLTYAWTGNLKLSARDWLWLD